MSSTSTRVAVITGGSRGIGRATALKLASQGYSIVVNYSSNATEAKSVVAKISASNGRAIAVQGDVADETAMAAVFEAADNEFGGVDVIVHAAGRMILGTVIDLDLAVLDSLHRTNIRGTFVVNQLGARKLRAGGAIVNFSTSVVGLAFPTYAAYSSSKGAVEALTMILARELRGRDITVNVVAPGPTATDLFLDGKDAETIERLSQQPPLQRLGTPEDIANVAAFLVSNEGHWINGQVVRANGGII
jgi:3-oxoacyl-[acyl-carrier protein] reductase